MNRPYSQEFINQYNSVISPSTVHIKNTALAQFFKRYLLEAVDTMEKDQIRLRFFGDIIVHPHSGHLKTR